MSSVNSARRQLGPGAPAAISRSSGETPQGSYPPPSPPARRPTRRSWRDPRLLFGIAVVAVCVLAGSRLLATADDTVAVWSTQRDLVAGTVLSHGDLERSEIRFVSAATAQRYVSASDAVPGMVLTRDLAAGELLPRSALGGGVDAMDVAELPISVAAEAVPADLRAGQVVDVWVTPGDGSQPRRAVRVLSAVRVVDAPPNAGALGPSSTRQVVVGVPADDEDVLAQSLASLAQGTTVLVRQG